MSPPLPTGGPIRPHVVARVMARRGRLHWFDRLDPARTALAVIDMQATFCAPGAPAEVPGARAIVPAINRLAAGLRQRGVPVFWVLHANARRDDATDWDVFFDHVVAAEMRARTLDSLAPGRQTVWEGLDVAHGDEVVIKNRYSALARDACALEQMLRARGVDTLLIAGTKTDVCCESTARDAMMLGFKVVMAADCCAALSADEHRDALETIIQQFGDVRDAGAILDLLDRPARPAPG